MTNVSRANHSIARLLQTLMAKICEQITLPRLMGPFSGFTVFVGVISSSWCGRQNQL